MSSEHTQDANSLRFSHFLQSTSPRNGGMDNLNCTSRTLYFNTFRAEKGNYLILFSLSLGSAYNELFYHAYPQFNGSRQQSAGDAPLSRGTLRRRLIPFAKNSSWSRLAG